MFKSAEVLKVNIINTDSNYGYSINFKFTDTLSNSDSGIYSARPLHTFLKYVPVPGEIVNIIESASSFTSGQTLGTSKAWYFLPSTAIHADINYNGIDGATNLSIQKNTTYLDSSNGISTKLTNQLNRNKQGFTIGNTKQLIPYIGDLIIESRYGSSIRMTTTLQSYSESRPFWNGEPNSPIIIIRNTVNNGNRLSKYVTESFNDDSLIILSSNTSVPLKLSSKAISKGTSLKVNTWSSNPNYNQIILSSDRLILNSKSYEVLVSAKNGIHMTSENPIVLESSKSTNISSPVVNLTQNPSEPAVLGNQLVLLLSQALNIINSGLTTPGTLTPILSQIQNILSKGVKLS